MHPTDHDQLAIALREAARDLADPDAVQDVKATLEHLAQLCADRATIRRVVSHNPHAPIHGFGGA
jgi:hypothetical protein